MQCVNGETIRLKRNTQGDPILTEKACNHVNRLTIQPDRNHSYEFIHVCEDTHQHHQNPVALVVCLQKNKLHGCESAMNKILSLPTTAADLFVKKNLAKNSSGLAVEVGFGHLAGKHTKSVKTGIKNKTGPKKKRHDNTNLTCGRNLELSKVVEPMLLEVVKPIKKMLDTHKAALPFFTKHHATKVSKAMHDAMKFP